MDSTRAFLNRMNKPPVRPAVLFQFRTKDGRVYAKLENGQIVRSAGAITATRKAK